MAQKAGSPFLGKTPARGTFAIGNAGPDKKPIGGNIKTGTDLRAGPGKNAGGMPKSMT